MGLYDSVRLRGPKFVCSEGHDLSAEEFQTKDLGQTMGEWEIGERLVGEFGDYRRDAPSLPFSGQLDAYASCRQCPAFVQPVTGNMLDCWVEFRLSIVNNSVVAVERISPSTAKWLESDDEYMRKAFGPMSTEEAEAKRREIWGAK